MLSILIIYQFNLVMFKIIIAFLYGNWYAIYKIYAAMQGSRIAEQPWNIAKLKNLPWMTF